MTTIPGQFDDAFEVQEVLVALSADSNQWDDWSDLTLPGF